MLKVAPITTNIKRSNMKYTFIMDIIMRNIERTLDIMIENEKSRLEYCIYGCNLAMALYYEINMYDDITDVIGDIKCGTKTSIDMENILYKTHPNINTDCTYGCSMPELDNNVVDNFLNYIYILEHIVNKSLTNVLSVLNDKLMIKCQQ